MMLESFFSWDSFKNGSPMASSFSSRRLSSRSFHQLRNQRGIMPRIFMPRNIKPAKTISATKYPVANAMLSS